MDDKASNSQIVVWAEFQVHGEEPGTDRWIEYLQAMVQAPGHAESVWARIHECPDTLLVVTLWHSIAAMKEFEDSPSAQLFWENLTDKGIRCIGSYETIPRWNWFGFLEDSHVQLFWVYFHTPMTEEQRTQISKLKGIRPPLSGPGVSRSFYRQNHPPVQIWTIQAESLHETRSHLMLWPHFWVNAEKAEWRHTMASVLSGNVITGKQTRMEAFGAQLDKYGPVQWRDEFCDFKSIPRV